MDAEERIVRFGGRGFTLIELLVVVLILSILMAVALPLYLNAVADASRKTCRSNMASIASAEQAFKVRDPNHQYTQNLAQLTDFQGLPVCPSRGVYSAVINADGSITIHCSIAAHDASNNPATVTGYTPGLDSQ